MSDSDVTAPDPILEAFRAEIDVIDDKLIALLKSRTDIVKKVGKHKAETFPGICPLRAGREAMQVRRVVKEFTGSSFLPAAGAALWRNIINASLAVEGEIKITVFAPNEQPDLYWLAREYFGSFIAIQREGSVKRVIGDIIDGKSAIGIIPVPRSDEASAWWPDLAGNAADWPKIFTRLPFVEPIKSRKESISALAIGKIKPEPTGDDISYLALDSEENVSLHKLQTSFGTAKLEATWIDVLTDKSGSRRHLVEVKGFITPEHEGYKAFLTALGGSAVQIKFLGAYATPITLTKEETRDDAKAAAV